MKINKVSTSLLPKFPCDVMIHCLYQSQHSMEDMKMGKKQAKSRHYTEKQKLTPNNLHLCIRNKGERIKGKEQERSQEIKTRREKKEKETSLTSRRWSMHFSSEDQRKGRILISTWGRGGMSLGDWQTPSLCNRFLPSKSCTKPSCNPQGAAQASLLPALGKVKLAGSDAQP